MANVLFPTQNSQKTADVWQTDHTTADEGNFFVTTNPTVGTPIATTTSVVDDAATASSTHAQYSPVALLVNSWSTSDPNPKVVYLRYLKMLISQVPTSATSWQYAMRLDYNPTRLTTPVSILTPVNINSNTSNASRLVVNFGALTTALPSSNARLVARGLINSAVPVTLDQWVFTFGDSAMPAGIISGGSGAKTSVVPCGPICIAPGWSLSIEMWGASNAAAPSWELELGHVERPSGL